MRQVHARARGNRARADHVRLDRVRGRGRDDCSPAARGRRICGGSRWSSRIRTRPSTLGARSVHSSSLPSGAPPTWPPAPTPRPLARSCSRWSAFPGDASRRVPSRVQRRPAAADLHCARAGRRPVGDHCRRADLRAGCLGAGPDRQPTRLALPRPEPRRPLHLARPRDRAPCRRLVTVMYLGKVVESSLDGGLWANAAPSVHEGADRVGAQARRLGRAAALSPGEIPDPASPPAGCRFHPRCRSPSTAVHAEEPVLREIQTGPPRCLLAARAQAPAAKP